MRLRGGGGRLEAAVPELLLNWEPHQARDAHEGVGEGARHQGLPQVHEGQRLGDQHVEVAHDAEAELEGLAGDGPQQGVGQEALGGAGGREHIVLGLGLARVQGGVVGHLHQLLVQRRGDAVQGGEEDREVAVPEAAGQVERVRRERVQPERRPELKRRAHHRRRRGRRLGRGGGGDRRLGPPEAHLRGGGGPGGGGTQKIRGVLWGPNRPGGCRPTLRSTRAAKPALKLLPVLQLLLITRVGGAPAEAVEEATLVRLEALGVVASARPHRLVIGRVVKELGKLVVADLPVSAAAAAAEGARDHLVGGHGPVGQALQVGPAPPVELGLDFERGRAELLPLPGAPEGLLEAHLALLGRLARLLLQRGLVGLQRPQLLQRLLRHLLAEFRDGVLHPGLEQAEPPLHGFDGPRGELPLEGALLGLGHLHLPLMGLVLRRLAILHEEREQVPHVVGHAGPVGIRPRNSRSPPQPCTTAAAAAAVRFPGPTLILSSSRSYALGRQYDDPNGKAAKVKKAKQTKNEAPTAGDGAAAKGAAKGKSVDRVDLAGLQVGDKLEFGGRVTKVFEGGGVLVACGVERKGKGGAWTSVDGFLGDFDLGSKALHAGTHLPLFEQLLGPRALKIKGNRAGELDLWPGLGTDKFAGQTGGVSPSESVAELKRAYPGGLTQFIDALAAEEDGGWVPQREVIASLRSRFPGALLDFKAAGLVLARRPISSSQAQAFDEEFDEDEDEDDEEEDEEDGEVDGEWAGGDLSPAQALMRGLAALEAATKGDGPASASSTAASTFGGFILEDRNLEEDGDEEADGPQVLFAESDGAVERDLNANRRRPRSGGGSRAELEVQVQPRARLMLETFGHLVSGAGGEATRGEAAPKVLRRGTALPGPLVVKEVRRQSGQLVLTLEEEWDRDAARASRVKLRSAKARQSLGKALQEGDVVRGVVKGNTGDAGGGAGEEQVVRVFLGPGLDGVLEGAAGVQLEEGVVVSVEVLSLPGEADTTVRVGLVQATGGGEAEADPALERAERRRAMAAAALSAERAKFEELMRSAELAGLGKEAVEATINSQGDLSLGDLLGNLEEEEEDKKEEEEEDSDEEGDENSDPASIEDL
mmetsp:Transcript_9826/g.22479  ORF Transcript_9826/g.22479 Transcript_9826/m.22479 type:complete len:1102 (-) Transcript_9826:166-3471(-)